MSLEMPQDNTDYSKAIIKEGEGYVLNHAAIDLNSDSMTPEFRDALETEIAIVGLEKKINDIINVLSTQEDMDENLLKPLNTVLSSALDRLKELEKRPRPLHN